MKEITNRQHRKRARAMGCEVELFSVPELIEHWITRGICPGRCVHCGDPRNLTMEHWVPLSRGGPHSKDNLYPMCLSCNAAKGDAAPENWILRLSIAEDWRNDPGRWDP